MSHKVKAAKTYDRLIRGQTQPPRRCNARANGGEATGAGADRNTVESLKGAISFAHNPFDHRH
jgi:hypothetical protein